MKYSLGFVCLLLFINSSYSQIISSSRINPSDLGLDSLIEFGYSLNNAGDFNQDGFEDIVFSSSNSGFYIGLLDGFGNIDSTIVLDEDDIDFLHPFNARYLQVDQIGDLNKDGTTDFVISSVEHLNDDGSRGTLYLLTLKPDGSILEYKMITPEDLDLSLSTYFGHSLKNIGDIDANGYDEIGIALPNYGDSTDLKGAVLVIFLGEKGDVIKTNIIQNEMVDGGGGSYGFGFGITGNKDLNGDGYIDLIVGNQHGNNGAVTNGSSTVLYLDKNAEVIDYKNIFPDMMPQINGMLIHSDRHFGASSCIISDITNDNIPEVIISYSWACIPQAEHTGFLVVISLDEEGNILNYAPIFDPIQEEIDLIDHDHLGNFLDIIEDYNGDGFPEIITQVQQSYDNGYGPGNIRILQTDFAYLFEGGFTTTVSDLERIELEIYPNPTSEFTEITTQNSNFKKLILINNFGQAVLEESGSKKVFRLDISNLSAGMYWIKLIEDGRFILKPLIKN